MTTTTWTRETNLSDRHDIFLCTIQNVSHVKGDRYTQKIKKADLATPERGEKMATRGTKGRQQLQHGFEMLLMSFLNICVREARDKGYNGTKSKISIFCIII